MRKLSELKDTDFIKVRGVDGVYTVKELKDEILYLGKPHHLTPNWYQVSRHRWRPSPLKVLEEYILAENSMSDEWKYNALSGVSLSSLGELENELNKIFPTRDVKEYWRYIRPIEIDILPTNIDSTNSEISSPYEKILNFEEFKEFLLTSKGKTLSVRDIEWGKVTDIEQEEDKITIRLEEGKYISEGNLVIDRSYWIGARYCGSTLFCRVRGITDECIIE